MIESRKATMADAESLAPRLRDADVAEISAGGGGSPMACLVHGVNHSEPAMTIYRVSDGLPVGMYGVVPSEPFARVGVVWLLGTSELVREPLKHAFLRRSRRIVQLLNETYPVLTNLIDSRNILHIQWIEWMGFHVERAGILPAGGDGVTPFYQFSRRL